MTIIARPIGSGNWTPIRIEVRGDRAAPLLIHPGHRFVLGGITWRVVEVLA